MFLKKEQEANMITTLSTNEGAVFRKQVQLNREGGNALLGDISLLFRRVGGRLYDSEISHAHTRLFYV